jgi:hypothetical protein
MAQRTGEEGHMTAFLVLTEWEPFIVMASRAAISDGRFVESLTERGFDRFIAHEVGLDRLRKRYGVPFEVIEDDVKHGKEVRVLDAIGSRVFESIQLADLGACIQHDGQPAR